MKRLIQPAILLLNRLKYGQKAVLLGLVVLMPLIVTQSFLFTELNETVAFTRKERIGMEYCRPLRNLLEDLQQHRGMSLGFHGGDASFKERLLGKQARIDEDIAAVDSMDRRYGPDLRTTERWNILRSRVLALKTRVWSLDVRSSFDEHTALIKEILSLVTHVGNTSNLILDPQLDSYYLANAIVVTLPILSEYLGQQRALGSARAAGKGFAAEKTISILLRGKALAVADANDEGFHLVFQENPGLKPGLEGPLGRCGQAVRAFQELVQEKLIEPGRAGVKAGEYFLAATRTIDTVFGLYDRAAPELDAILAARIESHAGRRNLAAAVSLFALCIVVFLFATFHVSVKSAVSDMVRLAERLSAGDSGVRLEVASRDELGDLARKFNEMASRIGQLLDALNLRRKHAETIIASMPAGLLVLRGDLTVLRTNRGFRETFGLDESAAAGRPLEDVLPAAGLREAAREVLATGSTKHALRVEAQGNNGTLRSLRVTIAGTRLAEEERLLVVVEDVSEEKRLQEAEASARERIRLQSAALEAIAHPITVTDSQGTILTVNAAFTRQNGWSAEEAVGKNPKILQSGLTDARVYQELWRTIRGGKAWTGELVNRRKDGSTYIAELSIAPIRDAEGGICQFVSTHRDITESRKTEKALREQEAQLRQAQKMNAVGRLAGGIAHDFNNLLTAILGCSTFLLENLKPDDSNRADVLEIEAAGKRAAALTKQLLAFSRKQMLSPQRMDINIVVKEMQSMLRRLIGEDIELAILLHEKPLAVEVDRGQAEQVVMNLVLNARDALPNVGKIIIETAPVEFEEGHIHRHGNIPPGSYVMLAVSDTGCGMSDAVQSHLFEPFFTTKGTGKGTGLGLSTVYGIVSQSGGHVTACSEVGRGTTFKIYMPRHLGQAENCESAAARTELPTGSGTVLLVEDETSVRELARRVLTLNGFTVIATGDPLEALTLCERDQEPFRLLVTDMVMPKLSGLEMARKVRAARPGIAVLYMSGYTEHAILQQGLEELKGTFLQKPFLPRGLLEKVHEILGTRT